MIKLTVLIPDGYTRLDGVIEIYDPVHAGQPGQLPYQYLPLDTDLGSGLTIEHVFTSENEANPFSVLSCCPDVPAFVAGDGVNPFSGNSK